MFANNSSRYRVDFSTLKDCAQFGKAATCAGEYVFARGIERLNLSVAIRCLLPPDHAVVDSKLKTRHLGLQIRHRDIRATVKNRRTSLSTGTQTPLLLLLLFPPNSPLREAQRLSPL